MVKKLTDNKDVILCFLGSRLLFAVILLITHVPYSQVLGLFDALHYRNIAQFGYYHDSMVGFFPLVPVIIRYCGDIGLLIINNIAFLATLFLIKRILQLMSIKENISLALAVVAVSPLALFTSIEYTESLFLFFTVFAFYLFIQDKYHFAMGILLGLSVLTRNTGSLLFFAIFIGMVVRAVRDRNNIQKRIADIVVCYIPATLLSILYPVFLQIKFRDWNLFMDNQYMYWLKIHSNPFKTVFISLKLIFTDSYKYDGVDTEILFKINEIISLVFMLLVIFLVVKEISTFKKNAAISVPALVAVIYSVLFVIVVSSTIRDPNLDCPTDSFYRYYLSLFPIYLGVARFKQRGLQISLLASLILTLITSPVFCLGSFFF